MQHEETVVKPQAEKGMAGISAIALAALLAVTTHGVWWSATQVDVAKAAETTVKLRSVIGTKEISVSDKQNGGALPKPAVEQNSSGVLPAVSKAVPEAAKVDNSWEWRWQGRSITVDQVVLNSETHKPVQDWVKANNLVLKVKLNSTEQLIGANGNFIYDGKVEQEAAKITVDPGSEPGVFLVSISGQAPQEQPEKIAFTLKEVLVNDNKPINYKVDWKKYRVATTDGDGRTLINLEEQQPHKVYNGEVRLTHLYYGTSTLYLSVDTPAELKAPYGLPVSVDVQGLVVTNEKGETAPSVTVTSGVAVSEGVTATTIELDRNNFTDSAALLNVQVAKLSAKLVIAEEVPIK